MCPNAVDILPIMAYHGNTCRVKLINTGSESTHLKDEILRVCLAVTVRVIKLIPTSDNNFVLICFDLSDAEKLFTDDVSDKLERINIKPVMPPNIRANRSILIYNLDEMIITNEENVMKNEIEERNNWCKIVDLFKFKKTNGIKLVFQTSSMADSALSQGLFAFQLHIPPYSMKRDHYQYIKTCYICYKLDDHLIGSCSRKNTDFKVCSKCSTSGHTWKTCSSDVVKCINCKGNHSTLSYSCPARRECVKSSLKKDYNRDTYASKLSESASNCFSPAVVGKVVSCITLSLFTDCSSSSLQENLNTLLSLNGLSPINIGDMKFCLPRESNETIVRPTNGNETVFNSTPSRLSVPAASHPETPVSERNYNIVPLPNPETESVQCNVSSSDIGEDGEAIRILKRSDYNGDVTKRNLKKLLNDGKVILSSCNKSESDCLKILTNNEFDTRKFFSNIVKVPTDVFLKKLTSNLSVSDINNNSGRPTRKRNGQ